MTQLAIADAQQRLPEVLAAVRAGELVEILHDGWKFRLTAVGPRPDPPVTGIPRAGSCKGLFVVPADFKDPLEEMREYME